MRRSTHRPDHRCAVVTVKTLATIVLGQHPCDHAAQVRRPPWVTMATGSSVCLGRCVLQDVRSSHAAPGGRERPAPLPLAVLSNATPALVANAVAQRQSAFARGRGTGRDRHGTAPGMADRERACVYAWVCPGTYLAQTGCRPGTHRALAGYRPEHTSSLGTGSLRLPNGQALATRRGG